MLRTLFVLILVAVGLYYAVWGGAFYALLFYLGNAYFRPEKWVWASSFVNIGALKLSLLSGIWVVWSTLTSRYRLVFNGRIAMLFLFLVHALISTLMSEAFSWSMGYWIDLCKIIVLTYCMIVLVTDFTRFRIVILVIVIILGVPGAKQGFIYLIWPPTWGANTNPLPIVGDNNGVALAMLMVAALIMLLAHTTSRPWLKPLYWLMFVGVLARSVTTYSRGGFIALAVMIGMYWLRSRHKVQSLVVVAVLAAIAAVTLPDSYWERVQTIQTYEEQEGGSGNARIHTWTVAWIMATNHPYAGVGYMAYIPRYDTYDFSDGGIGRGRTTHSIYFQTLGETGFVGLAIYLLIFLNAFIACHRVRRLARRDASLAYLDQSAFALELGIGAFAVGGTFLSLGYSEIIFHFFALTIILERLAVQAYTDRGHPVDGTDSRAFCCCHCQ